jgi:hypothetical protein
MSTAPACPLSTNDFPDIGEEVLDELGGAIPSVSLDVEGELEEYIEDALQKDYLCLDVPELDGAIGMDLHPWLDGAFSVYISTVHAGSWAEQQSILPGYEIIEINKKPVQGMSTSDVKRALVTRPLKLVIAKNEQLLVAAEGPPERKPTSADGLKGPAQGRSVTATNAFQVVKLGSVHPDLDFALPIKTLATRAKHTKTVLKADEFWVTKPADEFLKSIEAAVVELG